MTSPAGQEIPAFSLTALPGVGRCLVAARDISALEEILEDQPAMLGPYYEPHQVGLVEQQNIFIELKYVQPLCLECLRKTDGTVSCPSCSLPLCGGEECQAD